MLRRPLKTYLRRQKNSQSTIVTPGAFRAPFFIDSETSDNGAVDNEDKNDTNPFESTFDRIVKNAKLPPPPPLPGPDDSYYNMSSSFENHEDSDGLDEIPFVNPIIDPPKKGTKRKKNPGKKIVIHPKKTRKIVKTKINDNDWVKEASVEEKKTKNGGKRTKKQQPVDMETGNSVNFHFPEGDKLKNCSIELIRLDHTSLLQSNQSNMEKMANESSILPVNFEENDDSGVKRSSVTRQRKNKSIVPTNNDDEDLPEENNISSTDVPENSVVPSSIFIDKTNTQASFAFKNLQDCYVDLVPLKLQNESQSLPEDNEDTENIDRKDEETFSNISLSKVNTNSRITLKKNCRVRLTRLDKIPNETLIKRKSRLDVLSTNLNNQSLMSSTPLHTRIKSRETRPIFSPIDKSRVEVGFDTLVVGGKKSLKVPSQEEEDDPTVLLSPISNEKQNPAPVAEEISTILLEDTNREDKNQEDTGDGTLSQEELNDTSNTPMKTPTRKLSVHVDNEESAVNKNSTKRLLKPLSVSAGEVQSPSIFDESDYDSDDNKTSTLSSTGSMEALRIPSSPEKQNVDGAVLKNPEEESYQEAGTGDWTNDSWESVEEITEERGTEEEGNNDSTEEENRDNETKEELTNSLEDGEDEMEEEKTEDDTGEVAGSDGKNYNEISSQDEEENENTGEETEQENEENEMELGEDENDEEEEKTGDETGEIVGSDDENDKEISSQHEEEESTSEETEQENETELDEEEDVDESLNLEKEQRDDEKEEDEPMSLDESKKSQEDESRPLEDSQDDSDNSWTTTNDTQESRNDTADSLQSSVENDSSILDKTEGDSLKVGGDASGLSQVFQDLSTEEDSNSTMKNSMECSQKTGINSTKISQTDSSLMSEGFKNLSLEKDDGTSRMETDEDSIVTEEKKNSCSPIKSPVNLISVNKLPEPYILLTRLNDPVRISDRRRDYSRSKKFELSAINESDRSLSKENSKTDEVEENGLLPIQEENGSSQEEEEKDEFDNHLIDKLNDSLVLYLKPGKQYARSLSMLNQLNSSRNLLIPGKGKKWRESVINIRNMQQAGLSKDPNESNVQHNGNFLDLSPRRVTFRKSKIIPDMDKSLSNICKRKTTIIAPRRTTIYHPRVTNILTNTIVPNSPEEARNVVFQRCKQDDCLPISRAYDNKYLKNCHKIGEGVYGEVFLYKNKTESSVIKIIPIEGSQLVNGEPQKKFNEILSEIIIAEELHNLRLDGKYETSGFVEVKSVKCLIGKYPKKMLELWNEYDDEKNSENDSPSMFTEDQMYISLELGNGGQDLEAFVFQNASEAYSTFIQIALTLAVGEQALNFEHRDMHWGNVLISKTKETTVFYKFDDQEIRYSCQGIKVSIIDFTLSRITYQGCCMYNDLALDPELFTAVGEYQFDVYRMMKARLKNDWKKYEPSTNIFWLHYTLDKMINAVRYNKATTKIHKKNIEKLEELKDDVLQYGSAYNFIMECNLITGLKRSSV